MLQEFAFFISDPHVDCGVRSQIITTHTEMIVCSCNVLSDDDVRAAVSMAADVPRTAREVYGCLGCSAECGRCARTIKRIMTEALGACLQECGGGCPHQQTGEGELATTGAE